MAALPTKIYADSYALAMCIFARTKAIPKAQRPTLGRGLEECTIELLYAARSAGVASSSEQKNISCSRASDFLDKIRIYTQLCKDLGFFSDSAFFEISEKSAAVGKQLGGWMRSIKGQAL